MDYKKSIRNVLIPPLSQLMMYSKQKNTRSTYATQCSENRKKYNLGEVTNVCFKGLKIFFFEIVKKKFQKKNLDPCTIFPFLEHYISTNRKKCSQKVAQWEEE